jgi:hypothetical protein
MMQDGSKATRTYERNGPLPPVMSKRPSLTLKNTLNVNPAESRVSANRNELLVRINQMTKKVNDVESKIFEKIRKRNVLSHANMEAFAPIAESGLKSNMPHPVILASLINAFYGDRKKRRKKRESRMNSLKDMNLNDSQLYKKFNMEKRPKPQIYDIPGQLLAQKQRFPVMLISNTAEMPLSKENTASLQNFQTSSNPVKISERDSLKNLAFHNTILKSDKDLQNKLQNSTSFEEKLQEKIQKPPPQHPAFNSMIVPSEQEFKSGPKKSTLQKTDTPYTVSANWLKLSNCFRFMMNIKQNYKVKLNTRKQICDRFYTENYEFILQSIIPLLKKPVIDNLSSLLDIKKNFDIVSEVDKSRITPNAMNALRVA